MKKDKDTPELRRTINEAELEKKGQRRFLLTCDHTKDKTRQEFKAESDVNTILKRHGALPPMREVTYGEVDYDLNLQAGLNAMERARQAWGNLPLEIRQKYNNWDKVALALTKGELEFKDGKTQLKQPVKKTEDEPVKKTEEKA